MAKTIYRKCSCGETAHDMYYSVMLRAFTWPCRNCGQLAKNRDGTDKIVTSK